MDINETLSRRQSIRAFTQQKVELALIKKILSAAANTPSSTNTQPWEVAVLMGEHKQQLQQKMTLAFQEKKHRQMDYDYHPDSWVSPFKERRKACGLLMYQTLGITRADKQRQLDQWAANYRAFDAPVMLLFFIHKTMNKGGFMDLGMFLQSLMLSAVNEGLSTCPQAALAEYPDIVRQQLGYPEDKLVACGMALGYADTTAKINSYRTTRIPADDFTRYFF